MARWKRGEATIERLLAAGELDRIGKSVASDDEAQDAVSTARLFTETAARILPELGFFSDEPEWSVFIQV
nr:hypothetical protein [Propionicimonas sp.]